MKRTWVQAAPAVLAATLLLLSAPAGAESSLVPPEQMPGPLKEVGFDQQLGDRLPLDARFLDESGRAVELGDYFGERPVILALVYYDCPMLCSLILNGLAKSLAVLSFDPGREFDVVVVSFDARETPAMAAEAKRSAVERYGRPQTAAGWHFLTASLDGGEEAVRRLTEAVGFSYAYLPESDEYAHASGIVIATPEGLLARYFYGIEYPPKDLRLTLVEASDERIGSPVDQLLLYCFRYDPQLGRYTAVITRVLRLTGVAFCVGLALFIGLMWRRERVEQRRKPSTLGAA